jgi:hypothetical protein
LLLLGIVTDKQGACTTCTQSLACQTLPKIFSKSVGKKFITFIFFYILSLKIKVNAVKNKNTNSRLWVQAL